MRSVGAAGWRFHHAARRATADVAAPAWLRVAASSRQHSNTQIRSAAAEVAPSAAEEQRHGLAAGADEEPTAVYVHLPFCKRKCSYCDFPVIAVGQDQAQTPRVQDNMRQYVELLLQEIDASQKLNRSPLQSVFFGGGTPSLLSLELLEELLGALDKRFGIAAGAEVSIEADPGTFDAARLRSYMAMGVTRVSVGVQTFQDELLQLCGRAHDAADVYRAIEAVHAAGVPSWSLDLMSGLPRLTEELWGQSLELALDAGPHHMSVYDLQVEEHTPFAKQYSPGEAPLPSDDSAANMYCQASSTLRAAGLEHYELSNYARLGHRCRHNMVYWQGLPFYALGLGSASYLQGRRFSRPKRLNAYKEWLKQFAADAVRLGPQVAGCWMPAESADDRLLDTVMLRLRLGDGLDLRQLAAGHPQGDEASALVLQALKPHVERGWVLVDGGGSSIDSVTTVRLADPHGLVVSNDIISDVFAALDCIQSGCIPAMRIIIALLLLASAACVNAIVDASTFAPAGLKRARTPQFVLFTHDDALTRTTYDLMTSVTNGRRSLNGCPAVATYFTTAAGTDCNLVKDLHARGNEIADHTVNHPSLLTMTKAQIRDEIQGARSFLAGCGIPASDVVGMRAPYLETKPEVRQILHSKDFLYDSTLIESGRHSLSGGMGNRVWPWDMAEGIPINCAWFDNIQKCAKNESYPGLWEVPVWNLDALGSYTMDYGADGKHPVFDLLKANFDAAYGGNRAPMPIFIHTPWLAKNRDAVAAFADYALSRPDVYFVTLRQLIAWMKNVVPSNKLTPEALGCGRPGGAGGQSNPLSTYLINSTTTSSVPAPAPSASEVDEEPCDDEIDQLREAIDQAPAAVILAALDEARNVAGRRMLR
ncbi:hypothetical protein D9Q98_005001 [Chlorella vulgaris]|uniref:Radical S-adenosyl methionine domain-containing protein 1, mitochondrial n=1 Tax=Chlorella vulgaris TaxID=3077 RepID=A0A9D4YWJ5_CHLVU|nr:hypothetical protein D9Q98_005001 [Chlorella vulgaris]